MLPVVILAAPAILRLSEFMTRPNAANTGATDLRPKDDPDDSASVQAATRVNAEQASKRTSV
jgi:hypothetical protein